MLRDLLYADDLLLMSETIQVLWDMFKKWKEIIENKVLEVCLGRANVMIRE